jgi:LmbE family N-acetylglucosaminyl deacetylase
MSMLQIWNGKNGKSPHRVLFLGAHSDDIEIGCGGTILRLIERHPNLECYWVVLSSTPEREKEARKSAALFLKDVKKKTVVVRDFRTSFFPFMGSDIKEYFEELKESFAPDLIFTHYRNDLHQDHRVVCDFTWNTFRNHLILEYEIPKYDGDLGAPNCFFHLDEASSQRKMRYILSTFKSQSDKHWFTEDTFRGLMRLRGVESNSPGKYAEAFYCRKLVF